MSAFHAMSLLFFIAAIVHAFFTWQLHHFVQKKKQQNQSSENLFWLEIGDFLSDVEVVFGIWVIPQLALMAYFYDWESTLHFVNSLDFDDPLYVASVMIVGLSTPIIELVERIVQKVAHMEKRAPSRWWLACLLIGPLMGSIVKEMVATAIIAKLLAERVLCFQASARLSYVTLALLSVNIALSSVLTNFAATPIIMAASAWKWDTTFMWTHFGVKALLSIALGTLLAFWWVRRDLAAVDRVATSRKRDQAEKRFSIPIWISCLYALFLFWIVSVRASPVIFLGSMVLFTGLHGALFPKDALRLRAPIMVAFFLSSLIIHAALQAWWIEALLGHMEQALIMPFSYVLSAFTNNAVITTLATQVVCLSEAGKVALISGVVVGGGLTLLGNTPNFAAYTVLEHYFPRGVSPLTLLFAAIVPTLVAFLIFSL